MNIDYKAWGLDIAKDDPNVICYGDGSGFTNNVPYYSLDGGIHFNSLPPFNSPNFAIMFYNRNTLIMQQWNGFYKLNINFSNPIGIKQISSDVPDKFYLSQNYPNPFNPSTKIKFSLPVLPLTKGAGGMLVQLIIYDLLGRKVATLVDKQLQPGTYETEWDASAYASGVYLYKMTVNGSGFTETKKLILLK